MVSSPGRIEMVRTVTSVPSGRPDDVAGADGARGEDGGPHRQQPVALAVDGLEHRGVARDAARLRAGGHDAPADAAAELQPHVAEVGLAPDELFLARTVQDDVGPEPAPVPRA